MKHNEEVQFAKFNCDADYNERFCEAHGIKYTPTFVLFEEFRTTGQRYNPPKPPSVKEMRLWLLDTLNSYVLSVCAGDVVVDRVRSLTSVLRRTPIAPTKRTRSTRCSR